MSVIEVGNSDWHLILTSSWVKKSFGANSNIVLLNPSWKVQGSFRYLPLRIKLLL